MLERLIKIFKETTGIEDVEITKETNLKSDLGLSSFDLAQLVCAVEDEFDVEISNREIKELKTVGDVIKHINNLVD